MDENSIYKEIKEKGNGQAIIYISKIDLKEKGWKPGDILRLENAPYVKSVKKRRNYKNNSEDKK